MAQEQRLTLPLRWVDVHDLPILYANQFMLQYHGGDFFLVPGVVTPPALTGPNQHEEARRLKFVAVHPVARLAVPRATLEALARIIQQQLKTFPPAPYVAEETEDQAEEA